MDNKKCTKEKGNKCWCKICRKEYDKQRYKGFSEVRKKQIKANKQRCSELNKKFVAEIKALGCNFCNENDPCCMDFHHRDKSKKEFNIGDVINTNYSLKRIANEIAKCDVVCANCHRKIHAGKLLVRKNNS